MYRADEDGQDRTAFRRAEKQYKLYYETSKKKKNPKHVDVSEVLDFRVIETSYSQNGLLPPGIVAVQCGRRYNVFSLDSRPGFYFIPGALCVVEQARWIKESLTSFPQPPNRTNHNAMFGPISDLFTAAAERRMLVKDGMPVALDFTVDNCVINEKRYKWVRCNEQKDVQGSDCDSISATVLLRKLRWTTLGLQFDWSMRQYNPSLPHNKIPDALCQLARTLATSAMSPAEEFLPDAAIVNYFGSRDTLGGHLDDIEVDWRKPIVSVSLGCKAIFLLGGKSRDDAPIAMFLRSGDVVLMAGEARECYHGIPRIFTDEENAEISSLESYFSHENTFLDYIRTSRININIRQAR